MSVYAVHREDPDAGIYFDYIVTAGQPLQGPMPLPQLPQPLLFNTNYPNDQSNYTYEVTDPQGDLPPHWSNYDAAGPYGLYQDFTFQDRKSEFWVYRGLNAGLPPLQAGAYNVSARLWSAAARDGGGGQQLHLLHPGSRLTETLMLTTNANSPASLPAGCELPG